MYNKVHIRKMNNLVNFCICIYIYIHEAITKIKIINNLSPSNCRAHGPWLPDVQQLENYCFMYFFCFSVVSGVKEKPAPCYSILDRSRYSPLGELL